MVEGWGLPEGVLAILVVAWSIEFIKLPMERFDRWGTFGFDLGIYDQGTWLLSRFKDPFVTIRGLELFGHHANIFLLLLAPFYWLGAGPIFLLVVQVLAQASGAIAVFLLARDLLRSKWAGVALGGRAAPQPHLPVAHVGVLPSRRGRDRSAAVRVLGGAEQTLAAGSPSPRCSPSSARRTSRSRSRCSASSIVVRGDRTTGRDRRRASTAYFFFATRVLIPGQNGIGPFYDSFFGDLGKSPTEVAFNSVRHPTKTWDLANEKDRKNWYFNMFAPVGVRPAPRPPRARGRGGDDLHQHRLVVPVHARLPVPLLGDRGRRLRGGDGRGDRVDLEPGQAAHRHPGGDAVGGARRGGRRELHAGLRPRTPQHYKDGTWPRGSIPTGCDPGRGREVGAGQASASVAYNIDTHMTHRAADLRVPGAVVQHQLGRARRAPRRSRRRCSTWCSTDADQRPAGQGAALADLLSGEFRIVSESSRASWSWPSGCTRRPDPAATNPPEGECFARPSLNRFQPESASGRPERSRLGMHAAVDGGRVADLLASSGSTGRTSRPAALPPPASGAARLQPRPA